MLGTHPDRNRRLCPLLRQRVQARSRPPSEDDGENRPRRGLHRLHLKRGTLDHSDGSQAARPPRRFPRRVPAAPPGEQGASGERAPRIAEVVLGMLAHRAARRVQARRGCDTPNGARRVRLDPHLCSIQFRIAVAQTQSRRVGPRPSVQWMTADLAWLPHNLLKYFFSKICITPLWCNTWTLPMDPLYLWTRFNEPFRVLELLK